MDLNKLHTSVKNNKRQIMEQTGYFEEEINNLKTQFNTSISSLEKTMGEQINYTSMLPTATSVNVSITTSTATNKQFTAPFNGYFYLLLESASNDSVYAILNRSCGDLRASTTAGPWDSVGLFIPCKKGNIVEYRRDLAPVNVWQAKFIKAGEV